jgi:23S rRNA pseudouridine1911/1915/1917 synthase
MTTQIWKFTVESAEEGLRLDQLISARTGLSRRKARSVLQMGGVQVARKRVRVAGRTLAAGLEVLVAHDDALGTPPDFMVPVLFEDDWLLVVDKPAGMASQGTQASDQHDLLALLQRQRPGGMLALQHRLDQGTSGILVLAKHAAAHLGSQFQARTIGKLYLARVSRPLEACSVDLAIGRLRSGPAAPTRYGCSGDLLEPRPARTDFRPATAEETAGFLPGFWVVAEPHSGRTHQIRVHLAHLGNPVLGDAFYQGEASDQLWLHAWKLELEHPVTGAHLALTAPPARFLAGPRP